MGVDKVASGSTAATEDQDAEWSSFSSEVRHSSWTAVE